MAGRGRRRLIDLCCKAGGTSMGYHMAGFEVWGVDKEPQPNFPWADRFYADDITRLTDRQIARIGRNFDAVTASPPCQSYSKSKHLSDGRHPSLIRYVRWLVKSTGLPYIIENVPGAPLVDPVQVCGSAVGLRVRRHRLFESDCDLVGTECRHEWQDKDARYLYRGRNTGVVSVFGNDTFSIFRGLAPLDIWRHAMGIDWMERRELAQAIPPAYTFWLGKQLMEYC